MMDPPRPEVAAAVATCHRAGIRTVMITGDYGLTAECDRPPRRHRRAADVRLVTGDELDAMTDDASSPAALRARCSSPASSPEHKLRVVARAPARSATSSPSPATA